MSLTGAGLGLCLADTRGLRPRLAHCQFIPGPLDLAQTLAEFVRAHELKGVACHAVLTGEDYKLLPAETPAVPEAEIDQALLWGLRELLDAPPADTVLVSFPFATGLERPGKRMRHAVAARKSRILDIAEAVNGAGLVLQSVDIAELALCTLTAGLPEDEQGVALVVQIPRGVFVGIVRGGELYVARQVAGIADLSGASHPLTAPGLAEQLSLEILRTLDYYDSQLGQRPLAAVYLQPLAGDTHVLTELLAANLPVPVRVLRYADRVDGAEAVDGETQSRCLLALGAALRREAT